MKITLLLATLALFISSNQIYKVDSSPLQHMGILHQLTLCAWFEKGIEREMCSSLIKSYPCRGDGLWGFEEIKLLVQQNVQICRTYEWNIRAICLRHVEIYLSYVLQYKKNMTNICMRYVLYITWYTPELCLSKTED